MNASSSAAVAPLESSSNSAKVAGSLPLYCYILVFGATCIPMGVLWDVSWHSTIGRDTFWTPAHMLTYLGGLIPGLTCGWLALKTHFFGTAEERAASVSFLGFRAPFGAWIVIWGTFTMLLSAPFDNWWHNAYGLDVKILSPPHTVLAIGMLAVALGILFLMASWQNRAGQDNPVAALLFVYVAGVLLLMASIFLTETSLPNHQHASRFYLMSSRPYPLYLIAAASASRLRWPATITAAVYMSLLLVMVWTLPLFEAHPKLAPVYNPVDRMVPPAFPLLLIVPGFAIDVIMHAYRRLVSRDRRNPERAPLTLPSPLGGERGFVPNVECGITMQPSPSPLPFEGRGNGLRRFFHSTFFRHTILAVVLGIVFIATFMGTQWNVSKFLISAKADNWFFAGGHFLPYYSRGAVEWRHRYWDLQENPVTPTVIALATLGAVIASRVGVAFGTWMSRVKR